MPKSILERAKEVLETELPGVVVEHTPFGMILRNQQELQVTPEDLQLIASQEQMARVIAGLADSIGPDMETEEEANDLEWDEPDAFNTSHTVREVVEEYPIDPPTPPAKETQAPTAPKEATPNAS